MVENKLPWIVVVTHGHLGEALVESVGMIAGTLKNVKTVALMPGDTPEQLAAGIEKAIVETGSEKALILVDMFGGTPSNVSALFAKKGHPVLTGVNVPLLLGAEMFRSSGRWDGVLEHLQKEVGESCFVNVTERVKNLKPRG